MKSALKCIHQRSSIRDFTDQAVPHDMLRILLEAGNAAPSGKNGQPWRYTVIQENKALHDQLAELSVYRRWVKKAPCLIVVWLDHTLSYDIAKDTMAIGACIQNILLAAQAQELGCCWLGEILAKREDVGALLTAAPTLEPMAVLAVGYPTKLPARTNRRPVRENLIHSDPICD